MGNGNGFDATLLAGEQFAGAGPTYNGVEQTFSIMLAFFDHRNLPEAIRQDLIGFANPAHGDLFIIVPDWTIAGTTAESPAGTCGGL
jgi:hypothetical protein